MTYKFQVSIIIVNYNTFDLTCAAIRSIREKTVGVTYEIILVDNNSSECNPEMFRELFQNIILIKNPENSGFAKGNNLGISYATGETVLLFNSDAELINDAISICYRKLQSDKNIGVVSSKLLYPDGTLQYQCGRFPSVKLQFIELFRLQKLLSAKQRGEVLLGSFFSHEYEIDPDWVWGTFFLVRREVILKLPGSKLPEDFFMYAEDLQWCFLIREMGYIILYDPNALVLHHFSQSTKKNKTLKQNLMILENEDIFLRKHYGIFYTKLFYCLKYLNLSLSRGGGLKSKGLKEVYWNFLTSLK